MSSFMPSLKKPSGAFVHKKMKIPTAPNLFGDGVETTASGHKRLSKDERIKRNLEATAIAAEKDNPQLAACIRAASPVMAVAVKCALLPPHSMITT